MGKQQSRRRAVRRVLLPVVWIHLAAAQGNFADCDLRTGCDVCAGDVAIVAAGNSSGDTEYVRGANADWYDIQCI